MEDEYKGRLGAVAERYTVVRVLTPQPDVAGPSGHADDHHLVMPSSLGLKLEDLLP